MEGIISTLLSILGLGQRSVHFSSGRKGDASRINSEFEAVLGKTAEILRSEHIHLRHRVMSIAGDVPELHQGIDFAIERLLSEIEVGLATAINSRSTILSGSSFASQSKWDDLISLLYEQKAAAEILAEKSERCVKQFHRILDQALDQS